MNALLTNPFKERLRKGEVQIGLWLSSTTAYMAEIAATSGYDWLLIDGEHAPNTIQDLYHQLQAVAPYASHPVIRPVEGSKPLIKQVLDIGAGIGHRLGRIERRHRHASRRKRFQFVPVGHSGQTDNGFPILCNNLAPESSRCLQRPRELLRRDGQRPSLG